MTDKDYSYSPILYTAEGDDAAPVLRSMSVRFRWWPYAVLLTLALFVNSIVYLTAHHKPVTDAPLAYHKPPSVTGGEGFSFSNTAPGTHVEYHVRPAPPDHPTSRILVDGDIVTVHYTRRSELLKNGAGAQSWIGGTNPNMIWLPDDADGREIRELMVHELLHFALHKAGGEYQDPLYADRPYGSGGESVINPAARIMLDILRDNPKLVEWLGKHQ